MPSLLGPPFDPHRSKLDFFQTILDPSVVDDLRDVKVAFSLVLGDGLHSVLAGWDHLDAVLAGFELAFETVAHPVSSDYNMIASRMSE